MEVLYSSHTIDSMRSCRRLTSSTSLTALSRRGRASSMAAVAVSAASNTLFRPLASIWRAILVQMYTRSSNATPANNASLWHHWCRNSVCLSTSPPQAVCVELYTAYFTFSAAKSSRCTSLARAVGASVHLDVHMICRATKGSCNRGHMPLSPARLHWSAALVCQIVCLSCEMRGDIDLGVCMCLIRK